MTVTNLDEHRPKWGNNRKRMRKERGLEADRLLRIVICGPCGETSPLLDGPAARRWWKAHKCSGSAA